MSYFALQLPATPVTAVVSYDLDQRRAMIGKLYREVTAASHVALLGVLSRISNRALADCDAQVGQDGSVGLLWRNVSAYAYLDILADGWIHYYYEMPGDASDESVVPGADDLPPSIYDAIVYASDKAVQIALLPHSFGTIPPPRAGTAAALISITADTATSYSAAAAV